MLDLIRVLADHAGAGSILVVESDHRFSGDRLTSVCEWDVRHYPPAVLAIGSVADRKGS